MYPERQAIKMEKTNILNYIFLICLIDTFIGQYNGPAYIAHSTADCKVHTALHSLPTGHSTASTSWLYYFKIGLIIHALFITVYVLKNIKNRSHDTIHIFKNYFTTILSIFSFSNNKPNPNETSLSSDATVLIVKKLV